MLFGDELQSQLNAIRASIRISQFGSHNKSTFQRHPRNDREKSFLSKGPNPRWSKTDSPVRHQKNREGGNKFNKK
jgi:hypothetical protein